MVAISLLDKLRSLPPDYIESAIKCITFGIPPFADERLKQYVKSTSALKRCFCHFVKDDDVVPKLFDYNLTELEVGKIIIYLTVELIWLYILSSKNGTACCLSYPLLNAFGIYNWVHL